MIGRADLLNLHVASVEDGDAQLEGAGHHGAETTWDTHTHTLGAVSPCTVTEERL